MRPFGCDIKQEMHILSLFRQQGGLAARRSATLRRQLANAVAKQRPGQSAVTMLREILVEMSHEIEADADLSRLRLELFRKYPETMSGAFEQQKAWNSTLTKVVAERMGVDDSRDMRPALIVGVMMSAGNVALQNWFAKGAEQALPELVDAALDQTIVGLGELDRVLP
jgi:hypothetical protein